MPKRSIKSQGKPLVVNFYAGPGCGKTTAALELTAALKKAGYNVEYISEFAKDLVLENKVDLLKDQQYVTDGQYHRLDRIRNTTDIIVTDSPVLLGLVYGEMNGISEEYAQQIRSYYDSFDNFDMLMVRNRNAGFQQEGRVHDEKQSIKLDGKIEEMLKKQDVFFGRYKRDDIAKTVERITTTYNRLYGASEGTVEPPAQPQPQRAQSSGRWQQLHLGNDCLVKTYEKGTMFRLPPGCGEYSGYVFFHPNSLVKNGTRLVDLQSDSPATCKTLLYTEGYTFTLKDNGKEIQVSGEQLKAALHRAETQPQYENGKEYLENCPGVLRSQNKFICLRLTWDETKGKFAKMPINPHTGEAAKVNDPATWGSFEEATAAVDRFGIKGGIGYILTGDDNIVGIDLDLDPKTHELTESGKKILSQMKGKTYIEYSASGAVHIFGFGEKPGTWTRGAEDSNLEMYGGSKEGNRSLMFTGKVYDGKAVPMANIQTEIDKIYNQYFQRPEIVRAPAPQHESTLGELAVLDKLRSAANSQKFERLMRGDPSDYGGDYSKADLGLCSLIAFYTRDEKVIDSIYRQSGLYSADKVNTKTGRTESRAKKWDSPRRNGTYGQEVISTAIASVSRTYSSGTFEPTAHLMVYKQTDKAVLVKVPKNGDGTLKEPVWLPKSRIELDKEGKRVVAADNRLIDEHHLPRFVPKPLSVKK